MSECIGGLACQSEKNDGIGFRCCDCCCYAAQFGQSSEKLLTSCPVQDSFATYARENGTCSGCQEQVIAVNSMEVIGCQASCVEVHHMRHAYGTALSRVRTTITAQPPAVSQYRQPCPLFLLIHPSTSPRPWRRPEIHPSHLAVSVRTSYTHPASPLL